VPLFSTFPYALMGGDPAVAGGVFYVAIFLVGWRSFSFPNNEPKSFFTGEYFILQLFLT
jgi:hypothetical protein